MYNKPTFYTYTFLVQSADKIVVQLKLMMLLSLAHFFVINMKLSLITKIFSVQTFVIFEVQHLSCLIV